jgi:signal transduction histidine kinase
VTPEGPEPGTARDALQRLLRHSIINAVFCSVIALALAVSGPRDWDVQFVYSMAIGFVMLFTVHAGWWLIGRGRGSFWDRRGLAALLLLAGFANGFVLGTAVGDAYSGKSTWDLLRFAPGRFTSIALISLFASIVIAYYYFSRGQAKSLEAQIAAAQRDAAEARLKLLETQLEPHMLFNTLANLRALITLDPPRAVTMLDRLNDYLRVTLAGSRAASHPLSAEFARLADYLELMAVRMGPRLRYTLDLPGELRDLPMPPLLLQPLVENSIRHGLEPKVDGGEITVRAHRTGRRITLEVCDTGVGVDADAPPPSNGGFGLTQVKERLATLHGDGAALRLTPLRDGGTCASISFPVPL